MNLSRAPKDYALLVGLAIIWSGSFVFIKIGVDTVGPLTLTAARLGIAAGVLYLWLKINGERLPRDATSLKIFAFIGLFGTVWGIMNSFQSIATAKNTSLAIVAPGIAEALLATALGLLAAIPAVIAYNKISTDVNRYYNHLEIFLNDFSNILSKHLSTRK